MTNDRTKLQQIAGIEPSSHWLEACRNELTLVSGTNNVSPDAILEQILHHDLRDVVRQLDNNNNNTNNTASSCTAARELRRAQHQSMQASHNYKATLPENFRLLVQVEEFLDVSVNAEVRLAVGPASTSAPTAVGNQQNRCLRMVYSDGHYPNTENTPQSQQQDVFFLAMELAPIPSLSVQSYAGIKVLLTGPMEFRHGMALWHEGNTTVLGGQVEDLVHVQRKALQQAKLVAGVGVDPTIKALIWNHETAGLPEEEDEGEHESRDVTARAPLAPVVEQQQRQQQPMQPPPPRPPATRNLSQTVSSSSATVNRSHVPPPPPVTSSNPVAPPPTSRTGNFVKPSPTPSARFQQMQQQQQSRTMPPATMASTKPSNTLTRPKGPPASSPFVTAASMVQGQPSAPSLQNQQQQRTLPVNPYNRGAVGSASISNRRTAPGSATSTQSTPAASMSMSSSTPMSSASSVTSPPLPTTSASAAATTSVTMTSTAVQQQNNSNYPNNLSYDQLYERVQRAMQNVHAYRQLYGQVFSVQLKQVGMKEYFNIEKRKNRPKGDDKKHEYVMGARFQGMQGRNEPISCRVDSCILEPHFAYPPGEMRKLSKTNKEETNNLVRDGGRKVLAQLQVPRYYEVSLNLSPEEYFQQENDKQQQVLLLRKML